VGNSRRTERALKNPSEHALQGEQNGASRARRGLLVQVIAGRPTMVCGGRQLVGGAVARGS
jgi:hypothetical protein